MARADRWALGALLVLTAGFLAAGVVLPLWEILARSVSDEAGAFVGLANFVRYIRSPSLSSSFTHTLTVAAATTAVSVTAALGYAYGLTRAHLPCKGVLRTVALVPMFAPTLMHGIALVYLLGNKGALTTGLFGLLPKVPGFDPGWTLPLYGPVGIVLAETVYTFPQAFLILSVALSAADARLYESAETLGAGKVRTFFTVTLPGLRYGLLSAAVVCFTLSFTDFGAPKVVGGRFNVLATDLYKQVVGQQNFSLGAAVSVVLLLPTVAAFLVERFAARRQTALLGSRAVPLEPGRRPLRDALAFVYCLGVATALVLLVGAVAAASLVKVWPYDFSLGLGHYDFESMGGGGYGAFWNTLRMAACTSIVGTAVTFGSAYLVEKWKALPLVRRAVRLVAFVPLALPGLVLGLSYIFFFNRPSWSLGGLTVANPLHALYGTMALLVVCNVVHFYSVGFLTATTALQQLDPEFETVSESLAVPQLCTLGRVTVPLCLPALFETALYFFVNATATVSALVFLYSADLPLASVAVVNMDDAGDTASAAAMSVLILGANLLVRVLYGGLTRGLRSRAEAWRRR